MKRLILAVFVLCLSACTSPDDDSTAKKDEARKPPFDALQYYLDLKKLNKDRFERANDVLTDKEREQVVDFDGKPVSLIHSIKLITGGANGDRQAFLIQESYTQPDGMYPDNDRYMCTIMVLIFRQDKWELENNDMFTESDYEGGTRWAGSCDSFELGWENGFPVLSRTETYGPYAGGVYVSNLEKVRHRDGKYVLEVVERKEGGINDEGELE